MILKEISFSAPLDNILYDEVLLYRAQYLGTKEFLRIWESSQTFIVLGRSGHLEQEVRLDNVPKEGLPILRRRSGGGTVLQGKGCLNYSLILSKRHRPFVYDLHESYQRILGMITESLRAIGFQAVVKPLSDLVCAGNLCKFSGNAQHRMRDHVLHHGTVLYDFDVSLMEKYLTYPCQVPKYRAGRSHTAFVMNVPLSRSSIQGMLVSCFRPSESQGITQEESECLQQFREKYSDLLVAPVSRPQQEAYS